ncbi:MAG: hypothetical protein ACT4NL_16645 [Pseudomarimonas sp.]
MLSTAVPAMVSKNFAGAPKGAIKSNLCIAPFEAAATAATG